MISFGDMKTAGPDGFTIAFLVLELKTSDDVLYVLFDAFHKGTLKLSGLNYTFISLIPKKEGVFAAKWSSRNHLKCTFSKAGQVSSLD